MGLFRRTVFLLVLALGAAGRLSAAGSPSAAYRSWLGREGDLVAQAERACKENKGLELGPLREAENLANRPGRDLAPEETIWLAQDCAHIIKAERAERLPLLRSLTARIEAYQGVSSAGPSTAGNPGMARDTLRRILDRPEFAGPSPKPTWWQDMIARAGDAIRRALLALAASGVTRWGLIAAAVAVVLVMTALIVVALGRGPRSPGWAGESGGGLEPEERRAGKRQDLYRLAEEACREGRFRDALRLLYVSLLRELDRAGVIRLVSHKTNWDYRRTIEQDRRDLAVLFGPLTEMYEAKWYGREQCGTEDFAAAKKLYDAAREAAR